MTEDQERALRDFEAASKRVKACLGMKQGGDAAEKNYSQAYQAGVRLGIFQPIKRKYR
jgi:hypothetical protein